MNVVKILKCVYIICLIFTQTVHTWDTSMPGGLKIGINGKIYSFTTDVCSGGVFFKRPVPVEFVCTHGYFFRRPNGCLMADSDVIAGRSYVCLNQSTDLDHAENVQRRHNFVQAFIPLTTPELPLEHTIAFYDDADTLRNFRRYSFLKGLHHMYDPHDPGSSGVVISNTHNTPEINIGKLCYQGIPATGGAAFVANLSFDFSGEPGGFFSRRCKKSSIYFPWRKTIRFDFTEGFSDPHHFAREIQAVPGGESYTETTTREYTTEVPTIITTTTELLPQQTETYLELLSIEEDEVTTEDSYYDSDEDYTLEPVEPLESSTTTTTFPDSSDNTEDTTKASTATTKITTTIPLNEITTTERSVNRSEEQTTNKSEDFDLIKNIAEQMAAGLRDQEQLMANKEGANLSHIKGTLEQVSGSLDQSNSDRVKEEKEDADFLENILKHLPNPFANEKREYAGSLSNLMEEENKKEEKLYTYVIRDQNNYSENVAHVQTGSTTLIANISGTYSTVTNEKYDITTPVSEISGEITSEEDASSSGSISESDSGEEKEEITTSTSTIADISSTTEILTTTNKPLNILDSSSDEVHEEESSWENEESEKASGNEIYRHSPIQLKFGPIIYPELASWDPYVEEAVFLAKTMFRKEFHPPGCQVPTGMPHGGTKWFAILKAIVPIVMTLSPEELIPGDFFENVVDLFGYVFRTIPDDGQSMDESIFQSILKVFSKCAGTSQTFLVHVIGCPKKAFTSQLLTFKYEMVQFNKLDLQKADGSKAHVRLHKLPPKTSAFRSHRNDVVVESVWTLLDIALCTCYATFLSDNVNEYYRLQSYMKQIFLNERVQKRWFVAFKGVDTYSGLLPFGDYKTLMYNLDKVKAAAHTQCSGAEWHPRPELVGPDYSQRNIFKTRVSHKGEPGQRSRLYDSQKPGDNPDPFVIGNEEIKIVRPFKSRPKTKIGTRWRVKRDVGQQGNILDFIRSHNKPGPLQNGGAIRSLMDNDSNRPFAGVEISDQIENTLSAPKSSVENGPEKPGFKPSQLEIWDGMAYCLQANYEETPDGKLRMRGITPSVESLVEFCDEKDLTAEFLHQKPYPNPYEKKGRRVD